MSGIIEIWRESGLNVPLRFTVGEQPAVDNDVVDNGSPVKSIEFRETGAFAGKRMAEPVFVIHFEESTVQRFIPARCVVDIAYESAKPEELKAPELED